MAVNLNEKDSNAYILLINSCLMLEDYKTAAVYIEKLFKFYDSDPDLYYNAGVVYFKLKN